MASSPPVVVLLEGRSDVAALRALLRAAGLPPDAPVELVDMGGVTNIRSRLADVVDSGRARAVFGLCDAAEAGWFVRALQLQGVDVRAADDLPDHGFFVCRADLEDELIRALGTDVVLEVFARLGLARRFGSFSGQEFWRDRTLPERLHRFAGIASGRKAVVAGALAGAVPIGQAPEPLRALLGRIDAALTSGVPHCPAKGAQ